MIRPITVFCSILALGAGLYLYRAKHEVELMDRHIDQIARETSDIRAESRRLLDDWIRLGEPLQLQKYSDQYLGLKAISPPQFVRMSDLPARLPEPRADPVEPPAEMVAQSVAAQPGTGLTGRVEPAGTDVDEAEADELPIPPIPPASPLVTSVSLQAVTPPLQARPVTPRPRPPADTGLTEERHLAVPRTASMATSETHPAASGLIAPPVQIGAPRPLTAPPREQPPLQAREQPPFPPRGLPPLQAQSAPRPGERTIADGRPEGRPEGRQEARISPEPRRDTRPAPDAEPRAQAPRPPPGTGAPGVREAASPGSLLGMPRGPVPLPLPAPTPVNAVWNPPPGASPGPGR